MDGIATIAYEIFESLGDAPGSVVCPAGHGSFLLGIARGFQALKKSGAAAGMPALVAVQAAACAPMLAAIRGETGNIPEEVTIAEGVRVRTPVRSEALLAEIRASSGEVVAVAEKEILPARDELAGRGFYVEPTSAIAWAAFKQLAARLPEPVVLLLSGTGFKYNSNNS
jgi:threonine synthase